MEEQSANKVKRIEFTTMSFCKPCKPALKKVKKIAKKHNIPVIIQNRTEVGAVAPVACVVKNKDGVEVSDCVKGYGKGYKKDIKKLIEG